MGFEGHQPLEDHPLSRDDRIEILQKLDQGALNPEQAGLMLRGKGKTLPGKLRGE